MVNGLFQKKLAWIIFFVLSPVLLLGLVWIFISATTSPSESITHSTKYQSPAPLTPASLNTQLVKVIKVVDGDTIEIEGGQRVRYIGVDTPETVDPRKEIQCFGKEAAGKNKELVEGKEVRLEKDVSETDKYGRLLRYVYVGDIFVNDYLVRNGFARVSTYPPDIKYQNQFLEAEKDAREENRGLWLGCPTSSTTSSQTDQTASSGNCLIKGNISSSGEKIYHLLGQRYYDKTIINTGLGERWFCAEEEAIAAGWRKSKV